LQNSFQSHVTEIQVSVVDKKKCALPFRVRLYYPGLCVASKRARKDCKRYFTVHKELELYRELLRLNRQHVRTHNQQMSLHREQVTLDRKQVRRKASR